MGTWLWCRGPYTRAMARKLAKQRRYYIAGNARGSKRGGWAQVPVWGFREEDGAVLLTYFVVGSRYPEGYCPLPPVSGNIFAGNGVVANQLGLNLDWQNTLDDSSRKV